MTRFARAKGSKASNEKVPDNATPWEVMKEQLLQAKKDNSEAKEKEKAEKQRIENYENFLKERKIQKRKATWCDFPEADKNLDSLPTNNSKKLKKKHENQLSNQMETIDAIDSKKMDTIPEDNIILNHNNNKKSKKQKSKKQCAKPFTDNPLAADKEPEQSTKQKKSKKKKVQNNDSELEKTVHSNDVHPEANEPNAKISNSNEIKKKNKKAKNKKKVDGKPIRRKEINDNSFQLIINSKEVELERYDGFPIMKKDADRIKELKSNMIKKGIPKAEVQRTIKLERRRAEKALARLKRDVCYNCRKGGHNLSDCPDLKSKIPGVDAPEGLCFKCGSTEHRQFECKVQRDKEFRFATCFICKEQGHIARQCPDNPKGLYPNGGSCKLCGDVTHLRKDCPTVNNKKEETSIKLQTLDSTDDIEGIGQHVQPTNSTELVKKPKKIKF